MTRHALLSGTENRPYLIRRIIIGLGMVSVLVCSILGGGILTLQEGVQRAGIYGTPTQAIQTPSGATTPTSLPLPGQTQARSTTLVGSITPASTATPDAASGQVAASTSQPGEEPQGAATPTHVPPATTTVWATITPLPAATTARCRPPASWQVYVVRVGDTITQLAWRHGTTIAAIMQANCLYTTTIFAGQRLYLPPQQVLPAPVPTRCVPRPLAGWVLYTVQPGDTLYSLAIRHGTTLSQIQSVNCLDDYRLFAGQRLYLPPSSPTATPVWTLAPTSTPTPTAPWTPTGTIEPTATITWPVTQTATVEPTSTQTLTLTPGPTPTPSPTSTWTHTPTPSSTVVPSETPPTTPTATPTETTWTPTSTAIPTPTDTPPPVETPTPTDASAPTVAPTATATTAPPTATYTPEPSPTLTGENVS